MRHPVQYPRDNLSPLSGKVLNSFS